MSLTREVALGATAYQGYKAGAGLSDEEVLAAVQVMEALATPLWDMGPEFSLAARACSEWGREAVRMGEHRKNLQDRVARAATSMNPPVGFGGIEGLEAANAFKEHRTGGNHIEDGEMKAAAKVMPILAEALQLMGPEFGLFASTCQVFGLESKEFSEYRETEAAKPRLAVGPREI